MKIVSIRDVSKDLLKPFSSGEKLLDVYLKQCALSNDKKGVSKTFVCLSDDESVLIGFFSLCSANIQFEEYIDIKDESIPHYPIPCIRIARLAVDQKYQGNKIGAYLLKECFLRILSISKTIGVYLVLVDAKESSIGFYEHYGFRLLRKSSLTYFIKLSTVEKAYLNQYNVKHN